MDIKIGGFGDAIILYINTGKHEIQLNLDEDKLKLVKSKIDGYFDDWKIDFVKMSLSNSQRPEINLEIGKQLLSIIKLLKDNPNTLMTAQQIAIEVGSTKKSVITSMTKHIRKIKGIPIITVHSKGYAWISGIIKHGEQ